MTLKNLTNNTLICRDLKESKSFSDQIFGLLKQSNPRSLLFKTRFGIHTFFLKESIDVIVLDSKYRVVKIKESLKPNSLFFWNPKHSVIIEFPKGTIRKADISQGNHFKLLS